MCTIQLITLTDNYKYILFTKQTVNITYSYSFFTVRSLLSGRNCHVVQLEFSRPSKSVYMLQYEFYNKKITHFSFCPSPIEYRIILYT